MDLRIDAGDWDKAVDTVLREAKGLLNSGRRQTLERWIEALPSPVRAAQPWLALLAGHGTGADRTDAWHRDAAASAASVSRRRRRAG